MIRRTYATSAELEAIAAPTPPPPQQQQQPRGAQPPVSSSSSSAQINTLLEATIPKVQDEATMAYSQEQKTTVQVEQREKVEKVEQGVNQQMGSSEPTNNPAAATLRLPSLSSSLNSLPKRPLSQIPTPHARRASHSPDRKHRRSNSLTSETGSLLALPVAAQLHALKARNTTLEATVTNRTAQHQLAMFKATSRIASLEKALAEQQATTKVETDGQDPSTTILQQQAAALAQEVEGWQAEAQRLQLELDSLSSSQKTEHDRISYELELEKSKKKTYRFLCAKLRSELHNRKAKEKWDLGVMDAADRARDVNEVQLEATIATLRMQVGIAKVDAEELQETIHRQRKKISALSASRSMLLNTVNASEATISALRSEINLARTEFTKENKALQKEVNALKSTLKDVKEREVELEKNVEEMAELKTEIKALKAEALRLEKGEKRSESKDAKELGEVRKSLEKEKTKREKVEAEVKEVKALLKSTQVELRDAQRSAALKSQALAPSATSNVARRSRAVVHVASDPVVASEPEDDDDDDDDEEEEEKEVLAPVVKANKTSTKLAPVVDEPASDDQGGEVYKPQKSRSRAFALPQKTKAIIAAATADVESEREGVAASKKRKMLGDKSGNTSTSPKRDELTALQPKKMKAVVKAQTAKMGLKEVLAEQAAEEEDEESTAPKKKKKRTLFGGGGKFAWDLIENADVNSLGLPSHLSPIKGGGGLGLGGTRPATTLGILGRGLTGGRKSIFS